MLKKLTDNRFLRIILVLECIILLFLSGDLLIKRNRAVLYTPPVSSWESRMISYDNGWHMSGQFYEESGYPHGEDTEILFGPFVNVPAGDYTLRITYSCDADQSFRVYAFEQEDKINPQNAEILMTGQRMGKYHYILSEDVENLEVRICFNGLGDIHIQDISFSTGYFEQWHNICAFFVIFLLLDALLLLYFLSARENIKCMVLAIISSIALLIDPAYTNEPDLSAQITGMFGTRRLLPFVLLFACFLFYRFVRPLVQPILEHKRGRIYVLIPSILFSLFLLIGYTYQENDSLNVLFDHHLQLPKTFLLFIGLIILLWYCIGGIYAFLDKLSNKDHPVIIRPQTLLGRYLQLLRIHPFAVTFMTLLIINLPYMITAYPGIFTGDTADQILQAFQIPGGSDESVRLLSEQMLINQHHPVVHTLLMHALLLFGMNVFHSANIGLALISILQACAVFAAIAYLICVSVTKIDPSDLRLTFLMAFFILSPRIQSYLFVLTKDVFYAAILLVSVVLLWELVSRINDSVKTVVVYALCLVGLMLFRNDAIYTIILQLLVLFFSDKQHRKAWISSFLAVVAVFLLLTKVVYPLCMISPSTVNEALSVPIQQTARYIRDYPEDVSEDEAAAINKVWDYDTLADNYNPVRSDAAKGTYRLNSTNKDLADYLKVWAKMFIKHPGVYFEAFLNNYYEYFYPGVALADSYSFEHAEGGFEYVNARCEEAGIINMHLFRPESLNQVRLLLEEIRETFYTLPFLSILLSVACYAWVLLLWFLYALYQKHYINALITVPLLLCFLVCLAGPCNGSYFRYFYPIVLCLPAIIALGWSDFFNLRP